MMKKPYLALNLASALTGVIVALTMPTTTLAQAQTDDRPNDALHPIDIVYNGVDVGPKEAIRGVTVFIKTEIRLGVEGAEGLTAETCSGTLISPDVVVTASHCVEASKKLGDKLVVIVKYQGMNGLTKSTTMKDFVIHPLSTGHVSPFDVALIRLADPIRDRRPVALAAARDFDSERELIVAGFGRSDRGEASNDQIKNDPEIIRIQRALQNIPSTPEGEKKKLALARQFIARLAQIQDSFAPLLRASMRGEVVKVTDGSMLKINDEKTAICEGDSGGPSFTLVDGRLKLLGVHSGGKVGNCDAAVEPSFFEKLFGNAESGEKYGLDVFVPDVTPWMLEQIAKWHRQSDI